MKKFYALLSMFLILLGLCLPVQAERIPGMYTAVISSHDLSAWFTDPKYKKEFDVDYLICPNDWGELDAVLYDITCRAKGQPILLDFEVHGSKDGLALCWDDEHTHDSWATMGYVLNHVQRAMSGQHVGIMFESCYAGRCYKYTIRGVTVRDGTYAEDYAAVPNFPIYGSGDNFRVIGPVMLWQVKHHFRKWFVDLRVYDPLGENRPLKPVETYNKFRTEKTTNIIWEKIEFFLD